MTAATDGTPSPPWLAAHGGFAAVAGSIMLGTLVAGIVSLGLSSSGSLRLMVMLPLLVLVPVVLAGLALTRFEAFLLTLLTLRASIDYARMGAGRLEASVAVAVLFVFTGLLWLAARRSGPRLFPATGPLTVAGLVFLGAALVSTATSIRPGASLAEWARLASVVMMLIVLERLFDSEAVVRRVLLACFASAAVPCVLALAQWASGSGARVINGVSRVRGTFLHPNSLAMYLTFLIVMAVSLLPQVERRWRLPAVVGLVVMATCLVLTYTRGAWIAVTLGLLVVGMLQHRRLVPLLLVLVLALALLPGVRGRFSDLSRTQRESGATGNSLVWRVENWKQLISVARERPATGFGPRTAEVVSPYGKLAHNDYVRAVAEGGVIGLIAYLILLGTFFWVGWRAWQRGASSLGKGIAAGFLGCTVVLAVVSFSDNVISQIAVLWYFAVFAAAAGWVAQRSPSTE